MRLWHKDLIDVLPRQQLMGQWRECCLIARQISVLGRPNHILVNKIMDYPIEHFILYAENVYLEMKNRGYSCDFKKFMQYFQECDAKQIRAETIDETIFHYWHDHNYLNVCYYNLKEKYDCGGVPEDEWQKFANKYYQLKHLYFNSILENYKMLKKMKRIQED